MEEMKWFIRDVRDGDAQGVIEILNPIIEEGIHTVLDSPFSLEQERQFIQNFPENGVFLVAVNAKNSIIGGFQNLEPFSNYTKAFDHVGIISTYVKSKYQRQGIASKLFEATFNSAKAKGFEKIFTYVRSDNEAALATYERQGFQIIGTAKKHAKINGKYIDEILIEKFL